jgi:aspartate aminotransferase
MLLRPEIAALQPSGIARVAVPRLGDPAVIPLWFGEGDRPTPDFITQAARAALDEGDTFYTFTRGKLELREAIRAYLLRLYGVDLHPDRVTVPGAAMLCVTIATQMVLRPGDHALAVSPYWPNIEVAMRMTGAEVSSVRQRQTANGWELTAAEIIAAAQENTRCIYVNSPCNPTGWIMPQCEQRELLDFCRERQILLLADEVYHRMTFEGDTVPSFIELAEEDDPVMVIYGMSKSWAMTGWRLGWVVAPRQWVTSWQILSENFNTGAAVFTQRAAVVALQDGEALVRELRAHYSAGRDIVTDMLGDHPRIHLSRPAGAFYAFPQIEGIESSLDFALDLLATKDVGVAPGYTFGPGSEQNIRICFARDQDQLREGLRRLLNYLDTH